MDKTDKRYYAYLQILKEELVPAMGCTEPIAIAYCAAKAKEVLGRIPKRVLIEVSGNMIKNVKSVIVPNTGGLKGIQAAAAAGIIGGDAAKVLEVIAFVTEEQKDEMKDYLKTAELEVYPLESDELLDIIITMYDADDNYTKVRIANYHTNIILIEKNHEVLYQISSVKTEEVNLAEKSLLNVEGIYEFAETCEINDVKDILDRQIAYNIAISEEGFNGNWGANVGCVLRKAFVNDVVTRAKAAAAAGSDARMGGCELPVIINSGSGNQGITTSVPVIVYAKELQSSEEKLYRALVLANLITIHQKTGIGRLSAYCGAVSAGCGAGCGIAYLQGGNLKVVEHTLVNSLAIVSGIVCDGAKPSCAAKIAASVEAGILGYEMYMQGQQFRGGDGILSKGVEKTIFNVGRLGKDGMKETDKEIIRIMTEC